MSNERYDEYYIEVLKSTLNAQVTQNLSMQAMALVKQETIVQLQKQIEELSLLKNSNDSEAKDIEIKNLKIIVSELKEKIKQLESKPQVQKKEIVPKEKPKKAIDFKAEPPKPLETEDGGTF